MIKWEVEEMTEDHKKLFVAQMAANEFECDFQLMLRTYLDEHRDEQGQIHEDGFTLSHDSSERFLKWFYKKHEGRSRPKDIESRKRDGFTIWEVVFILIAQAVMAYFYLGQTWNH